MRPLASVTGVYLSSVTLPEIGSMTLRMAARISSSVEAPRRSSARIS
jgi:hypothetical protein